MTEGLKEREKYKVSELKIDKERYINKAKYKMKKREKYKRTENIYKEK